MLIALDYDGTYTKDPELWDLFLQAATALGHQVIIATMRFESEGGEITPLLDKGVSSIVFTDRKAKLPALDARGIRPDIWIDDMPWWIFNGG